MAVVVAHQHHQVVQVHQVKVMLEQMHQLVLAMAAVVVAVLLPLVQPKMVEQHLAHIQLGHLLQAQELAEHTQAAVVVVKELAELAVVVELAQVEVLEPMELAQLLIQVLAAAVVETLIHLQETY